jgi:hypothetical protein
MATKTSKKTSKKKTSTVTRSAITGDFVTAATVQRHPNETVTQTVSKPKSKKKPAGQ